jgi:hypothetical protein
MLPVLLVFMAVMATAEQGRQMVRAPAEKTFIGQVSEVKQQPCEVCSCVELSVVLKTDAAQLEVRLGPKPFFEERDFFLRRGDLISVTGLRFVEWGRDIVLANEVRKGGDVVILRGKYGKPGWLQAHGHTCPICGN